MSFGEPLALLLLISLPVVAILMARGDRLVRRRLERIVAGRLLPSLTDSIDQRLRLWRRVLFLIALACFIFALAKPQWGEVQETQNFQGRDILLAIDTSKSMLSTDVEPSRLTRAKLAAEDLIESMPGDRFGLLAFAGEAQVEAPLTIDYDTVIATLNELNTNTVARGGTDIAAAIRAGELILGRNGESDKALVLITDGEELDEDGIAEAEHAAKNGIRIFTVGVGSPDESTIPLPNGQLLRDSSGKIVRTKLDEARLKGIAQATGGFYLRLQPDTVLRLVRDGINRLGGSMLGQRTFRTPIERYRWPLAFGLLLLVVSSILSERQRIQKTALASLLILTFGAGTLANAASAFDLYQQGDYNAALRQWRQELERSPHDPILNFNAGTAAYRMGRYDQAFENFSEALQSPNPPLREKAYYNGGNALFKEGDRQEDIERQLTSYEDAEYLYEQALAIDPNDEAAKKNLALVKRRIEELKRRKQQQGGARSSSGKQQSKGSPSGQGQSQGNSGRQSNQGSDPSQDRSRNGQMPPPDTDSGPEKKKQGDLRAIEPNDSAKEKPEGEIPNAQKMTPEEANGLLDSFRDDEDHVDLSRRKKGDRPVLKD
ncbi:MAG TPA: VWA domain-containing protein, partial [Chthoniobacterales bacterium]|nr:VWA domain-containing protein [Chthoniobacterales bacterium]